MNDRHSNNSGNESHTGRNRGMQGIDKAPGEEPAGSPEQFTEQTQKGKNKVDGDPSQASDAPLEKQDID